MNKLAKIPKKRNIILSILLVILLLPVVLHGFLKSPAIQTYLTKKAAEFLSEELGSKVKVGGVDIAFFFDIVFNEVYVEDKKGECLLFVNKLVVDIDRISLLNNQIIIDNVELDQPFIGLRKYKGDSTLNLKFLLDYFTSDDKKEVDSSKTQWDIVAYSLDIVNGRLLFHDYNKRRKEEGIDFSNIDVDSLDVDVIGINLLNDTILCDIENISFKENSGVAINQLSTEIAVFPDKLFINNFELKTPNSDVQFQLSANYNQLEDLFGDSALFKVRTNFELKPTKINSKDLSPFIPSMKGMEQELHMAAKIRGKFDNIRAKYLEIFWGNSTRFKGDFSINGLPNIDETFINFSIDRFITTAYDMKNIKLPGDKNLNLPKEVTSLGAIKYSGDITGFMNDFVAYGTLKTQLGNVSTDIGIKRSSKHKSLRYIGKISSEGFNIGSYFEGSKLGTISMNTEINGSGMNFDELKCSLKSNINQVVYNEYNYQNILIEAKVENKKIVSTIHIDDENIDLNINADACLGDSVNRYKCKGEIEHVDLAAINISDRDTILPMKASLDIDIKGNNPDSLNGFIVLHDFSYAEKGKQYSLDSLSVQTKSDSAFKKNIVIESDLMDLSVDGKFELKSLYPSFIKFINYYAPAIPLKDTASQIQMKLQPLLSYNLKIKDTKELLNMFMPDLTINPNSTFSGTYNGSNHSFSISGKSIEIRHKKNIIKDLQVEGSTKDDKLVLQVGMNKVFFSDSIWLDNFKVLTQTQSNVADFHIIWDNYDSIKANRADIHGQLLIDKFPQLHVKFDNSEIVINDSLWKINNQNDVYYDSVQLEFRNLKIFNDNQELIVNGIVSHNPKHLLEVNLDNFDISNFDIITTKKKMNFDGLFTGDVKVANIYKSPYITTDIFIKEFVFNEDRIGDLTLNSIWDNRRKAFNVDANIIYRGNIGSDSTLMVEGYFYPQREKDNFDLDINLKNFKLEVLKNYVKSFGSNLRGLATGKLKLAGSLKAPLLTGDLRLVVRRIRIDYLNESYHFSDVVKLRDKYISFDSVDIYDSYGNIAFCNGRLYHDNFKNFRVDLRLEPKNFSCLNTNSYHNELFYGKAFASGLIEIGGSVKDVKMNITAKTEKGTKVFIPISSSEEIAENDFIRFISHDTNKIAIEKEPEGVDLSGFSLNFDLNVDQNAEVQIILDATAGDIIKAKGNANLNMGINNAGEFNMYGEYSINEGDYLFTLENVINKKFKIEEGGSLEWSGDPYDATMDLKAIYKLRTSLYDLHLGADSSKKRVPVECVIYMKNKLFSPDISFDVEFPAITDEFKKNQIKEIIEPNINRHFLSLIVMNRFIDPNSEGDRNTNLVGTNTSELLSNQLSNWLSQISNDFDIGVNYRPGDEITSEEVNVALSTQLFNNRIEIDGNIGYEGDNPNSQQLQNSSNIVGDVNVEYKVTDEGKFRIKGFNRSNQNDLLNTNSQYTQGVGVIFRKEFNSFGELFKRKKRAEKEAQLSK